MAARYTEQLVLMEEPEVAASIRGLAERHRLSQAEVLRTVVRAGLKPAADVLADQQARQEALVRHVDQ